jgi:hypothetical protein
VSDYPGDFRIEIIPCRPQWLGTFELGPVPSAEPIDITGRVTSDGLGTINRALDRDLFTFRTGDVTLTALNDDGFFDELFDPEVFNEETIWSLRILRRGKVKFWGVVIGKGSVHTDPKEQACEITAYGLTKLLDMTSGENVKRAIAETTVTTATAGSSTLTIGSTAGLLSGDVLHLTNHVVSEDVTIRQVTSATVMSLEAPLVNSFAAGSPVTPSTPFYRFKSIESLARLLFEEAGIALADLRLSASQFNVLAPTPVNREGLNLTNNARRGITQYTGRWQVSIAGVDGYSQLHPDEAWIVQGLPDLGIYDPSPYYTQDHDHVADGSAYPGEPQPALFEPILGATQEAGAGDRFETRWGAADHRDSGGGNRRIWGIRPTPSPGVTPVRLIQRTTTNGTSYAAATVVADLPGSTLLNVQHTWGLEYDPERDAVFASWRNGTGGGSSALFQYRDLGGAAWVDCKQPGDGADDGYWGPRYIADLDLVLVLRGAYNGSAFTICAFRGSTLLWERPFPGCRIAQEVNANSPAFYPTRTARFVEGSIYITLVSDGAVQIVRSDDEFQTYTMRKIANGTSNSTIMACRVGSTYRIFCYRGTAPTGYFIAAPLYAGVIEYADFEGLSVAEGLKKLAILADALFSIDDAGAGHFVARDLYAPGSVIDISDRVLERRDTTIWDQTSQYVRVSGNGFEATAGDAGFASEGIDLESSFIPNEAFAQALADALFKVFHPRRKFLELLVLATDDGLTYWPLLRLVIDGMQVFVYESDEDLIEDEIAVRPLEEAS